MSTYFIIGMSDKQPVAEEKNEDEGPMYKAFGRCCNCGTDLKIKGPFFPRQKAVRNLLPKLVLSNWGGYRKDETETFQMMNNYIKENQKYSNSIIYHEKIDQ